MNLTNSTRPHFDIFPSEWENVTTAMEVLHLLGLHVTETCIWMMGSEMEAVSLAAARQSPPLQLLRNETYVCEEIEEKKITCPKS